MAGLATKIWRSWPSTLLKRALRPWRGRAVAAPPAMVEFDKYRKHGAYHWDHLSTRSEYRHHVETVCRWTTPGGTALDLGCGDGAYLYHVAAKCRHVVGVDGDPDGIACARQELQRHGVANVTLIQAAFAELKARMPRGLDSFDLIYTMDCIEHLIDPMELIEPMLRFLAPTGIVLVGTPLFLGQAKVSTYHVKEFTRAELEELLRPHFQQLAAYCLPAPVPNQPELVDRFYIFVGRRHNAPRWSLPPFAPAIPQTHALAPRLITAAAEPPARGLRLARPEVYYSPTPYGSVSANPSPAESATLLAAEEVSSDLPPTVQEFLELSQLSSVLVAGPHVAAWNLEKLVPGASRTRLDLMTQRHELAQANFERLPFVDRQFDAVVAYDLLTWVDNPVAVLTELLRVAKGTVMLGLRCGNGAAGSKILVYDPQRGRLFGKAEDRLGYFNVFASADVDELVRQAGTSAYGARDLLSPTAKDFGMATVMCKK